MSMVALRSSRLFACAAGLSMAAMSSQASIMVHFTGMNLVYDGSAIYDAGSSAGGVADPATADALATVDFFDDGTLVGSLDSNIWLDVFIPDVAGLSSAANATTSIVTPGNPGYFDLLMGTSPLASNFLLMDIESVTIVYSDIAGFAQFLFSGAVSVASSDNLPFGLDIVGPVTMSFSAQLSNVTSAGGTVTGFNAFGTGEYTAAPTPGTAMVLALGGFAGLRRRRIG